VCCSFVPNFGARVCSRLPPVCCGLEWAFRISCAPTRQVFSWVLPSSLCLALCAAYAVRLFVVEKPLFSFLFRGHNVTNLSAALARLPHSPSCGGFFVLAGGEPWVWRKPEMSTDQDWIGLDQDWSQFWPDQDWIGLHFFEDWRIRTGSDWEHIFCFNVIILNLSKILVVIRLRICKMAV